MGKYDPSTKAQANIDDRFGYSGHLIRGQAPHLLFEEAVRDRITKSTYWLESCFGLNAATLCDRAVDLKYIGGTFMDGRRPTGFLCLAFKMLQLNIPDEIIEVYLNEGGAEFKYLRALAAFYVRVTSEKSEDVYRRLEPLLGDNRKLVRRANRGDRLTTVDEFVDDLIVKERVCATSLWKLVPRVQLEDEEKLDERMSLVAHLIDEEGEDEDMNGAEDGEEITERVNGHGEDTRMDDEKDGVSDRD